MGTLVLVFAIVVVVAAAVLALWWVRPHGPDRAHVEHLLEPRLTTLPAMTVLQVVVKGDPNVAGKEAFGLLMQTYFRMPDVPRGGPHMPAPRARWPVVEGTPRSHWTGVYAMPVPESVTELPHLVSHAGVHVDLTTWEYGEVAEILHVGAYSDEGPTIERLKRFMERHHCAAVGEHEEEYLKGPGMVWRGNPRHYLTLIRYRVRRQEAPTATLQAVEEATRSR